MPKKARDQGLNKGIKRQRITWRKPFERKMGSRSKEDHLKKTLQGHGYVILRKSEARNK